MARVKLRVKHARAVKVGGACYKVKTKSAAKKRFSITATGRVMATQAGKRHNMRKRSCRHLNEQTGCVALPGNVARVVLKYFHLNH